MTNWTCPFCQHRQTLTNPKQWYHVADIEISGSKYPGPRLFLYGNGCSNPDCLEIELKSQVMFGQRTNGVPNQILTTTKILPQGGSAKPMPDYIPAQILQDYQEACLIKDLSPKASATLSRRCLQGMIRDFGQVKAGRLFDEIKELDENLAAGTAPRDVSSDSIAALNAIRRIGNIGAHMEKDVSLLIDVDPGEAEALINVIELLLEEWYIERHKRRERFASILAIDEEKTRQIKDGRQAVKALPVLDANTSVTGFGES